MSLGSLFSVLNPLPWIVAMVQGAHCQKGAILETKIGNEKNTTVHASSWECVELDQYPDRRRWAEGPEVSTNLDVEVFQFLVGPPLSSSRTRRTLKVNSRALRRARIGLHAGVKHLLCSRGRENEDNGWATGRLGELYRNWDGVRSAADGDGAVCFDRDNSIFATPRCWGSSLRIASRSTHSRGRGDATLLSLANSSLGLTPETWLVTCALESMSCDKFRAAHTHLYQAITRSGKSSRLSVSGQKDRRDNSYRNTIRIYTTRHRALSQHASSLAAGQVIGTIIDADGNGTGVRDRDERLLCNRPMIVTAVLSPLVSLTQFAAWFVACLIIIVVVYIKKAISRCVVINVVPIRPTNCEVHTGLVVHSHDHRSRPSKLCKCHRSTIIDASTPLTRGPVIALSLSTWRLWRTCPDSEGFYVSLPRYRVLSYPWWDTKKFRCNVGDEVYEGPAADTTTSPEVGARH
ncbi:hypothetical protein BJY52DRAFT_1224519 [Lactarius psammicola]|nr:hypothetical protein BJY52DRAFT_1224519 [Lactarius psammicola]